MEDVVGMEEKEEMEDAVGSLLQRVAMVETVEM